ncbi:MAG: serine hydrolase family protein [Burkholderiaceae bacterium]|nr:serine hydrolase family protein [Burkholderiaceae bacterium]
MTQPHPLAPVRILLLPGWLGSSPGHWQRRWEHLYGDEPVEQADWHTPRRDDWIARLEDVILSRPGPVALVGHSLGCHLAAAWAASSMQTPRVTCALLVAPPDLSQANLPPALLPWQRPLPIRALPFTTTVVASADDPYCSPLAAQHLAERWGASCVNLGAHGHLNTDSGLGDWPQGRALLQTTLQRGRRNTDPSSV